MINVIITGALGKMGSNNIRYMHSNEPEFKLSGATEAEDCPALGEDIGEILGVGKNNVLLEDNIEDIAGDGDVIIDFLFPEPTLNNVAAAVKHKIPIVIGTTGFSKTQTAKIEEAAKSIPIVLASNMSVGINLLLSMVKRAAETLDDEYDIEIVEMHHRFKKDAPSGTAISLAKAAAEGRGIDYDKNTIFGRQGLIGARGKEIAVHALRGGDVIGEHTVTFAAIGERIEFSHKAHSRDTFSKGAFRAAKWILNKKPGLYNMQDVLGLKL